LQVLRRGLPRSIYSTEEAIMDEITLIHQTLHQHFGWHGARLRFLTLFLIALFRVRTVNFSDLSLAMPSNAKADSRYKRLQRFFSGFELDYGDWAKGMMNLMAMATGQRG